MGTFPSVLKCRSLEATARTPPLQLPTPGLQQLLRVEFGDVDAAHRFA